METRGKMFRPTIGLSRSSTYPPSIKTAYQNDSSESDQTTNRFRSLLVIQRSWFRPVYVDMS